MIMVLKAYQTWDMGIVWLRVIYYLVLSLFESGLDVFWEHGIVN